MKKAVITLILVCSLVFSLNLKPYLNQNILAYDNKTNTQFIYDVYKMYFNKTPNLIYKPKLSLVPGTLIGFNELKLKDRTITLPYNDMFHGYILIGKLKDSNIIIFGGNLDIIKEYLKGNKHIKESVSTYNKFKLIKLTVDREIPIINDSFLNNLTRKDYKVYSLNDNLKFNVYNYPKFLYRIMFNKGLEVFIRDNNEYNQIVLENYDGKNVYISVSKNIPIFQYKQALLDCYYTGRFDLCNLKPLNKKTLLYLNDSKENGFYNSVVGLIPKRDIYLLKKTANKLNRENVLSTFTAILEFSKLIPYLYNKSLENIRKKYLENENKYIEPTPYMFYHYGLGSYCYNQAASRAFLLYLNNIQPYVISYQPYKKIGHWQAGLKYYNGHIYTDSFYAPYLSIGDFYFTDEGLPNSFSIKYVDMKDNNVYDMYSGFYLRNPSNMRYFIFNDGNVRYNKKYQPFYKILNLSDLNINQVVKLSLPMINNKKVVSNQSYKNNNIVTNTSSNTNILSNVTLNNITNNLESKTKELNLSTNNENKKSTFDQIKEKLNEFKDYIYKKFVEFKNWIMKNLGGML